MAIFTADTIAAIPVFPITPRFWTRARITSANGIAAADSFRLDVSVGCKGTGKYPRVEPEA
jgi:hypothetical protein